AHLRPRDGRRGRERPLEPRSGRRRVTRRPAPPLVAPARSFASGRLASMIGSMFLASHAPEPSPQSSPKRSWTALLFLVLVTALAIHIGAALVFWSVAKHLLARASAFSGLALEVGATTAALVFAVHPLRVESVAWATERRDVLSGLLALLTVRLYLRAAAATG